MKYITDLMAKTMPARMADGKGKGMKYPLLGMEALKLSLMSTDGVGFTLMNDAQLDGLNYTVQYTDRDAAQPKARKKKSDEARIMESDEATK